MKRHLIISPEPIIEASLGAPGAPSSTSGAIVRFMGLVRGQEQDLAIAGLEYEVFQRMAEFQFQKIFDELEKRWSIESVRVAHRVGRIKVGEISLGVEVLAAHRAEAFAACQFVIDTMKQTVPIWKKPIPLCPQANVP